MWDWLKGLFSRGYSGFVDFANDVRNAITNAIQILINQFVAWTTAGINLLNATGNLVSAILGFSGTLVNLLFRFALVYIPNAIASAVSQAFTWTEHRFADAVNFAQQRIAEVIAWAQQAYNDLRTWITGQVASIIAYIHDMAVLLNDVARRVYALLTNPRALADWVAGEIIGALWRWVVGNADTLARLVLGMAVSGALKLAGLLEQVIADVFL